MISLVQVGNVDESIVSALKMPLENIFNEKVRLAGGISLMKDGFDPARGQYLAHKIIEKLPANGLVLGVIDADIFARGANFIFGQADTLVKKAVISLARLHPEYYGATPDSGLLQKRTLTEAVHELGHLNGLGHCPRPDCVMHFSQSIQDTDAKGWHFCPGCHKGKIF